jgi:predicted RND superfamily exporter protein
MVAAFVTVIWGAGFTGWAGIAFDPLVLVIPMLITARAVSHTVQMAERFFEDYERLFPLYGDAKRAKLEAAAIAMGELIVPGTLGILTDVAGLLVILVTTIPQMRDLGVFGAFWVAAIVVTVEILHPS